MQERKTIKINDEEISYFLSEKAIHIDNNDALKRAVLKPKASTQIAELTLEDHKRHYHYALPITTVSLAAEIYGHVFPEQAAEAIKKIPMPDKLEQAINLVLEKTDVIDAGHESIDGNRKIWDAIAKIVPI
ncbi:hypothetical protein AC622_05470 [Bacillus sp. FJAT-27916]|uniref:hypothetical protein n=1 Tax=Bacillus sp. FJAT-27916 TaxID=1679169 RepID=UPI00067114F2|nr:hypothetical protein [Bacillus sp. FJAT-27916]KMY43758.1 hypothetical protein AC622_05470 [Bacillus sp. FJAT-27916]